MRRRDTASGVQPPARLVEFDPGEWLPLVDSTAWDGQECITRENWRLQQALVLWSEARDAWYRQHGWPGRRTCVDLEREELAARRAAFTSRRAGR